MTVLLVIDEAAAMSAVFNSHIFQRLNEISQTKQDEAGYLSFLYLGDFQVFISNLYYILLL